MQQGKRKDDAAILLCTFLIFGFLWSHQEIIRNFNVHLWLLCLLMILAMILMALGFIRIRQERGSLKPQDWDRMSGAAFEDQIVIWLNNFGYSTEKTEYYDQGIDILAAKNSRIFGVQVKRSSKPVGVAAVRAAVAGLKSYGCHQAMVITNASFTAAAIRLADANECRLIDGDRLREGL